MAIELKDLDKALNKFFGNVARKLQSGQLAKSIGEQLEKDVIKAMNIGKQPDGIRLRKVAALEPSTKKEYKRKKLRVKARFEQSGDLKRSIKHTTKKGIVKVSALGTRKTRNKRSQKNREIIQFLKSTKTKSGSKNPRLVFGLTNTRRKIVVDTINRFLKATFE